MSLSIHHCNIASDIIFNIDMIKNVIINNNNNNNNPNSHTTPSLHIEQHFSHNI